MRPTELSEGAGERGAGEEGLDLVTMGPSGSLESVVAHANISSKVSSVCCVPGSWIENKVLLVARFGIMTLYCFQNDLNTLG